ncbi:MAG: DUF1223 domain-containing protein [Gemmataceae bacterium]|nr:DUF1223 domain-containing protein [Gemmataceae bacterium]
MGRIFLAVLTGMVLVVSDGVRAADDNLAGNWKLTLTAPGQTVTFWLIKLEAKDGKLTGEVISTRDRIPKATVSDISVKDSLLRIALKVDGDKFTFEGKLPPDGGKKITGSLMLDRLHTAQLELTTVKSLDAYDLAKDVVATQTSGPELFDSAMTLLKGASAKKATAEEVRSWASKAYKASETHGTRWQLDLAMRMAEALSTQEDYTPIALQYARNAERLIAPTDKPGLQKRALSTLVSVLKKAGKDDEAKDYEAKMGKIEMVAPIKFAGRKAKSDKAVMVELFTGAECPPCVAADLAFDALGKTYKPSEVILLQYHLHIPGPDPLTNADNESRQKYYSDEIEGTPTILFNGQAKASGGGGFDEAQDKYAEYVGVINPILEEEAKAKVALTATRKGDKIEIAGTVSDLEKPGDNMRLRFALVEETVKYQGRNKLDTHHHVVRDLPGGAKGFLVKEKMLKQTVTVDLAELKKKLTTYLDEFSKDNNFPNKERPLALKNLRVIAWLQNDANKHILQSAEVPVPEAAKE